MTIAIAIFLIWNLFAASLMLLDKRRSRTGAWRIRERTFLLLALCGGAVGIWAGMYLFRHKTRHKSFQYGIPLVVGCQVAGLVWILYK